MIHPHTELRFVSAEIGYGLFATQRIPKGTITWVLDELDRVVTPEEAEKMSPPNYDNLMKYTYVDKDGNYFFCWDLTRYVNHSFTPNCMPTSLGFEIAIVDIEIGDEITNDYGSFNLLEPFKCSKGAHNGRTHVLPDDLLTFHKLWDDQIASAMNLKNSVDQPLARFFNESLKSSLKKIDEKIIPIPSLVLNYYRRPITL